MITHDIPQGSSAWHAHRDQHWNASDAAAMMSCSPYKTRSELLHEKHTGLSAEVSSATQRRFDDGHRFEALARPLAAAIVGEGLFPVTGSEGKLSASFDGLTMDESIAFEHKSLNDELRGLLPAPEMVEHEACNAIIPKHYRVQMQQQCMVSGASRVLFMATKWDCDSLIEARHCWYESDAALAAEISAGWAQFEIDLAAYVPPVSAPVVVAAPVQALPAVSVRVEGTIAVFDNFDKFEMAVRDFIEHRLILSPKTDQDFADLDTQIKAMKGARDAIKAGKAQMLAQIEPVDAANKRADMLDKLLQTNQSMAEKLLASEKENRRTEIVTKPAAELREFMAALNRELGAPYIPMPAVDFGGAIKGMRSLASMEDAVATRLANAKIDANAVAANVRANLKSLAEQAGEFGFLFADKTQLVLKAADDFNAVVSQRITQHQAEVARKEQETRDRIRQEEEAKAAAASRAALAKIQGIQNQVQAAQGAKPAVVLQIIADVEAVVVNAERFGIHTDMAIDAKRQTLDQLRAKAYHPNGAPRYSTTTFRCDGEPIMLNEDGTRSVFCDVDEDIQDATAAAPVAQIPQPAPAPAPAANVVPMRAAAPALAAAPATPPSMKLGDINALLSPITLTAEGLVKLGFPHAATDKSAKLYHASDLTNICAALHELLDRVQAKQAA